MTSSRKGLGKRTCQLFGLRRPSCRLRCPQASRKFSTARLIYPSAFPSWLCRVARLLQLNAIKWFDSQFLTVAVDPYFLIPGESPLFLRFKQCKSLKAQEGVARRDDEILAELAVADSTIEQLQNRIRDLESKRKTPSENKAGVQKPRKRK